MGESNKIQQPDSEQPAQPKRAHGGQIGNRNAEKSGHWARKVKLTDMRLVDISRQNAIGQEIARQADAIYRDGGGRDQFSELKQHLVQRYLRTELLIQSLDRWLLEQPTLINRRKKSVYPVLNERSRLVETSLRLAEAIGLEQSPPSKPTLADILRRKDTVRAESSPQPTRESTEPSTTQPRQRSQQTQVANIEELVGHAMDETEKSADQKQSERDKESDGWRPIPL